MEEDHIVYEDVDFYIEIYIRPSRADSVVPVSRPTLIFQPDPKTFFHVFEKKIKS